jgi:formylmethanofuran dehydrogenase subunit E
MPIRDEPPPEEPMTQCEVCHELVPQRTIVRIGGREVCGGCAAMWWGGDDEDDVED